MKLRYILQSAFVAIILLLMLTVPAFAAPLAHDQPDGANWIMADWALYSFLIFFIAGLFVFLVALKRGVFHNIEDAKYYVLSIEEEDYYTPDWAKED